MNLNLINQLLDNYNNSYWFLKERRLNELSTALENELDKLESVEIEFTDSQNIADNQKKMIEEAESIAKVVLGHLSKSSSKSTTRKALLLDYKIQALHYRGELGNESVVNDESILNDDDKLLLTMAFTDSVKEFKKKTFVIENHDLIDQDHRAIADVIDHYPDFALFLLDSKNTELKDLFLHAVIRNHIPVGVFIEYPNVTQKLKLSLLAPRVGRLAKAELLKIEKLPIESDTEKARKKVVTLAFVEDTKEAAVQRCSILDAKATIDFKGQTGERTIQSIFEEFGRKGDTDNTDFECFQKGITPFNVTRYKNVDFTKTNWHEDLPIFETIDLQDAQKRFGNNLDGTNWGLAIKGNTVHDQIDVEDTHVYLEIAIPLPNNQYRIFCFGKFPKKFAGDGLAGFLFLGNTVLGHVVLDQNIFYLNRKTYSKPFVIDPTKGEKMMQMIKEDIVKGLDNNLAFQPLYLNCSEWVHSILKEILSPEDTKGMFKINFLAIQPGNKFLAIIFKIAKIFPKCIQPLLVRLMTIALLPMRGLYVKEKDGTQVWKSIYYSRFWKDQILYQPIVGLRK